MKHEFYGRIELDFFVELQLNKQILFMVCKALHNINQLNKQILFSVCNILNKINQAIFSPTCTKCNYVSPKE